MSNAINESETNERLFCLTWFPSIRDNVGRKVKPLTWSKLAAQLQRGQEAPDRKDQLPTWSPTIFEGGKRSRKTVKSISLFTLDLDNEVLPTQYEKLPKPRPKVKEVIKPGKIEPVLRLEEPNRPKQVRAALPGAACVWHTSFSHGPDCPKYRFVFPLSRDVSSAEYDLLWPVLDAKLRQAGVLPDPATKDGSRTWFLPARTPAFESGIVEGDHLDVDALLVEANVARPPTDSAVDAATTTNTTKVKQTKTGKEFKIHPLEEVLNLYSFARSPVGRVYARIGNELVPVESGRFVSRVAREYQLRTGQFVGKDAIKNALLAYSGDDLAEEEVPVRIVRHDLNLYLDLGASVVEISAMDGVRVLEKSPVRFYRPGTARKLPEPVVPRSAKECMETLETFRRLLGVEGQDWHACLAWLLSSVGATGTYAILICKGEKGSGKSTRTRLLRNLIDPRRPPVTGLPKDEENLAIQAQNAHVLAYDNLRYLSGAMSDAICRLATGDGMEKRTLYSDLDLTVLEATRPTILNGISDVAKEPDLLDRALICTFRKVQKRKTEDEIAMEFEDVHAKVLGALCYLCSLVLRRGSAEVPSTIRMVGPAGFAAAVEREMGTPEGSIAAAYEGARDAAAGLAADDELVGALVDWFDGQDTWTGTMKDLLDKLEEVVLEQGKRRPRWLPETSRKLSADLDRYAENLRQLGIDYTKAMSGSGAARRNRVTFVRLGPSGAGEGSPPVTTPVLEESDDDFDDSECLLDGI